ncbi:MAG: hypothetical protein M3388_19375 [Acidobacteriota bacterium]|nr:hypothetical protein [Acidobacteriota bacterium]
MKQNQPEENGQKLTEEEEAWAEERNRFSFLKPDPEDKAAQAMMETYRRRPHRCHPTWTIIISHEKTENNNDMELRFDEKSMIEEIEMLEKNGATTEAAEKIAKLRQIVFVATTFLSNTECIKEDETSELTGRVLRNVEYLLSMAWSEIREICYPE